MVKIALCLTGHMRQSGINDRTVDLWKQTRNITPHTDVYIHTWNELGMRKPSNNNLDYNKNIIESDYVVDAGCVLNLWKAKHVMVEAQSGPLLDWMTAISSFWYARRDEHIKAVDIDLLSVNRTLGNLFMWYSWAQCLKMVKQSNIKYDYVIRSRPDFIPTKELPLDYFQIITPKWQYDNDGIGIHDWWATGPFNLMYEFNMLYYSLNMLWKNLNNNPLLYDRMINPHRIGYYCLTYKKIPFIKHYVESGYIDRTER